MVNAKIKSDVEAKKRNLINTTWALGETSEIILWSERAK